MREYRSHDDAAGHAGRAVQQTRGERRDRDSEQRGRPELENQRRTCRVSTSTNRPPNIETTSSASSTSATGRSSR